MKLILGAFVLLLASAHAGASLIENGGFEEPLVLNDSLHYEHRNGDELTGWTLFSTYRGTVQFDTGYAPVSEGSKAVQIEVPGDWILQSFDTVIGQEYKLTFDLSAFPVYGGPNLGYTACDPYCDSILRVDAGSVSGIFSGSSAGYTSHSLLFTAISNVSSLRFENIYFGDDWGNYPHLDNVAVNVVPIPAAAWLFGTALIGLIGFSRRRKAA